MPKLEWIKTPYPFGGGEQWKASNVPGFVSIIPPCHITFGLFELYMPQRMEGVERFDTREAAVARAQAIIDGEQR